MNKVQRFNRRRLLDAPMARPPNEMSGRAVVLLFNPSYPSRREGKVRIPAKYQIPRQFLGLPTYPTTWQDPEGFDDPRAPMPRAPHPGGLLE